MDEEHYKYIMKKGGAYEGALKEKEQGLMEPVIKAAIAKKWVLQL